MSSRQAGYNTYKAIFDAPNLGLNGDTPLLVAACLVH